VRRGTPSDSYRDATKNGDIALYPFVFNRRQTLQRASCQRTLKKTAAPYSCPSGGFERVNLHRSVRCGRMASGTRVDDALDDGSHIHRCPWAPVATPAVVASLFGTTELPDEVGVAHWIIYVWMSILSIVIMALYLSHVSDPVAEHHQGGHVCESLRSGREKRQRHSRCSGAVDPQHSPFALALNGGASVSSPRGTR
jgi:hypothetical protein